MKIFMLIISLAYMVIFHTGCQNKTAIAGDSPNVTNKYEGKWTSLSAEDLGNGTFGKRSFDLKNDTWEIQFILYLDSALTMPVFQFRGVGPYKIQGSSTIVQGADNALFQFDRKFVTLFNDDPQLVENFKFGPCNLKKGIEQEITKEGCSFLVSKSNCGQEYDLIKRAGDNLYFGMRPADGDMCSEDKRPVELSYPLIPVKKH